MSRQPIFQITIKCALPVPGKDAASLASAAAKLAEIGPALDALGLEGITVEDRLTSRPGTVAAPAEPQGATGATSDAQLSEIKASVQAAAAASPEKPFDPVEDRPAFLTRQKSP